MRASRGGSRFPGADLTFSRLCARFSGRLSPAEAADGPFPPSCRGATRRVASRSRPHEAAATAAPIPGADSTFSRPCARFFGRAESGQIARARCVHPATPKRGGWEERLPRRPEISGRGFNLFNALRPIFRARDACRSGGQTLSALVPGSDASRRVSKPAGWGGGADGNPGRGFNLFKASRQVLRAIVTAEPGGQNKTLVAIPGVKLVGPAISASVSSVFKEMRRHLQFPVTAKEEALKRSTHPSCHPRAIPGASPGRDPAPAPSPRARSPVAALAAMDARVRGRDNDGSYESSSTAMKMAAGR